MDESMFLADAGYRERIFVLSQLAKDCRENEYSSWLKYARYNPMTDRVYFSSESWKVGREASDSQMILDQHGVTIKP